jgi:hypothetical protein
MCIDFQHFKGGYTAMNTIGIVLALEKDAALAALLEIKPIK